MHNRLCVVLQVLLPAGLLEEWNQPLLAESATVVLGQIIKASLWFEHTLCTIDMLSL